MRRNYTALAIISSLLYLEGKVFAQNISINTTGAANTTLSMLEILQISTTADTKGLHINHSGAVTTGSGIGYGLWLQKTGGSTTNIAGYFSATGATTNNYALVVPSGGGNVGIGSATPQALLDLTNGSAGILSGSNVVMANVPMKAYNSNGLNGDGTGIKFSVSTSNTIRGGGAIVFERTGGNSDGKLHFATKGTAADDANIPIRMTVDQNGNVGVGLTAPTMKLHVIAPSTTGGDAAIFGNETGASGQVYGVLGQVVSSTGNASGVKGFASAATGSSNGVWGDNASTSSNNAAGVYGTATGVTSTYYTFGVYGSTVSTANRSSGVYGEATGTTGQIYGLSGASSSNVGIGAFGNATHTTGANFGVYGLSSSAAGAGVYGINTYSLGAGAAEYGVYGAKTGNAVTGTGYGVYGTATGNGATNIGGYFSASGATANYALRLGGSTSGTLDISPAATTTSYSAIMPSAIGTANQVLAISSVAGTTATLGWAAAGGGSSGVLNGVQVFTANGTYVPTAGTTKIFVEIVGGGGGGGGGTCGALGFPPQGATSGGGGGGAYCAKYISTVAAAGNTIVIGAGGTGGSASGDAARDGSAGGTSSFLDNNTGTTYSAAGGSGGKGFNNTSPPTHPYAYAGGAGGTVPTSGDIRCAGGAGGAGIMMYIDHPSNNEGRGVAGKGGDSHFGEGPIGRPTLNATHGGYSGTNYGTGASGIIAIGLGNGGAKDSGDGAAGVVIVWEFK